MDVIKVSDVWKKFRIYHDRGLTLKEKILFRNRNKFEDRWVLKGINLNIKKGETVGLIGENGSGKSTLLKLLTKIIYPNRGQIEIYGKVSSLLELGAGFHPDMTGRENIYTNASIFGLTKSEIDKKLDDIIAFSELEEFIDNPVRTYSSGMYMRLAFSVAINVEPDILLIDEILAVGDANFQKKCFDKLQRFKKDNVTIVFVSHDLNAIEKLCDRAVWINNGIIEENGEPYIITKKYLQYIINKNEKSFTNIDQNMSQVDEKINVTINKVDNEKEIKSERWGNKNIIIYEVSVEDEAGKKHNFYTGDNIIIKIKYKKNVEVDNIGFGIAIKRADNIHCYGTNTFIDNFPVDVNELADMGEVKCIIENLSLLEGTYFLDVAVHDKNGLAYDYITNVYQLNVNSDIKDVGIMRLQHKWII